MSEPSCNSSPRKIRLSTGTLRAIDSRQLEKLKAQACAVLDARWRKDNRPSAGLRGRPSAEETVVEACRRIQSKMLRRKTSTLGDWYKAVEKDLCAHSIKLSVPPIKKFTRKWLIARLPFTALPEEIGAYYVNSYKDFEMVKWILVWTGLSQQFPEVRQWLTDYQSRGGGLPFELPHEILPLALQKKMNTRLDFELGPRCYDALIREALHHAKDQCEEGSRYPLVLRAFLGN